MLASEAKSRGFESRPVHCLLYFYETGLSDEGGPFFVVWWKRFLFKKRVRDGGGSVFYLYNASTRVVGAILDFEKSKNASTSVVGAMLIGKVALTSVVGVMLIGKVASTRVVNVFFIYKTRALVWLACFLFIKRVRRYNCRFICHLGLFQSA